MGRRGLLLFRLFMKEKPQISEGSYAAKHEGSHKYSSANELNRNGRTRKRGESAGLFLKETKGVRENQFQEMYVIIMSLADHVARTGTTTRTEY